MDKIKVLIVDDSAIVREFLSQILNQDAEIEVIGTAMDPIFAIEKILKHRPDVITLDVEMPRMDGLTFLDKLMKSDPIPVVMISSLTQRGCDTTVHALEMGAVDFIAKPTSNLKENMEPLKREIVAKVKNAARANIGMYEKRAPEKTKVTEITPAAHSFLQDKVIVIGASTGGVVAVKSILHNLPPINTSIIIALHMPPGFTNSFAAKLSDITSLHSKEAADGEIIKKGWVYVAPGAKNLVFARKDKDIIIRIVESEPGDFYKPSVNKAFLSAAKTFGKNAIGVLLTGMGDDGAKGLLAMKQAGAVTIAQDKNSCVVFGMPKRAIEIGAASLIEPLDNIAQKIAQLSGH